MFVTNGKVITTKDQNDLESLKKFIEAVFGNWATIKGKTIDPEEFYEERDTYVCYNIPEGMELNFLIDEGCDYLPIEPTDVIEKKGTQLVTYKHHFTAEEANNNADQMARFFQEGEEIEQQKKEVMSQFKAQKDEADAKVSKYANWVRTGYEMRDEQCRLVLDFSKGKRLYFAKNNKLVKEENMWPEDRQLMLPFVPQEPDAKMLEETNGEESSNSAK